MSIFQGDFLGFTFNGIHSSNLNIVRIIKGDRFENNLSPDIKDSTVDVPGSDGIYLLNTSFKQKQISIDFAFEDLTEENMRRLRLLFNDKQIHGLILDEEPYKEYQAKVTSSVKLSYIAFDYTEESTTSKIYKGEGSVVFTAFYPYAQAPYQTQDDYESASGLDIHGVRIADWAAASRILTAAAYISAGYNEFVAGTAPLYNAGEISTPLLWCFAVVSAGQIQLSYKVDGTTKAKVIIGTTNLTVGAHYRFNSQLRLLEGGTFSGGIFTPNGNIYNECLVAGDFFNIDSFESGVDYDLVLSDSAGTYVTNDLIDYDYLYY